MSVPAGARARVVLLSGPSGSGKSRLAARLGTRHGWPVVRLDDFYRDGDDPGLPRQEALGIPDWDDPRSWDGTAARTALEELVARGRTVIPVYDIATSRRVGSREVAGGPDTLVLAEGIFAPELIAPLRDDGLLHSAWCVAHRHPLQSFVLRLARDLGEHRKPPGILLRRGWTLMTQEPSLIARQEAQGARRARAVMIERTLR